MTYFLDFDRTLFDTAQMYRCAIDEGRVPERFVPLLESAVLGQADYSLPGWQEFFTLFEKNELDVLGANAEMFVFRDAKDFLTTHGKQSVIITFGQEVIQNRKIDAAGIRELVSEVMLVGTRLKGEYMLEHVDASLDATFVDDSPAQIASVIAHCPWVRVYEMRRDTRPGTGTCPAIRSFTELP